MPQEGRFAMPENTETDTQTETEDTTTTEVEETAEEQGAEVAESAEQAQEAEEQTEKPFDRAQAEAKIRKANSEAQNLRKRLKELEPKAAELQRIKDAEKSDTERLSDQLTAANERIAKTRTALAKSQVQKLAGATFADPEDAVTALDLDSYIDDEGEIDEAAIEADLTDLLARKPHWARAQPVQPQEGARRPAPDRTQASGANKTRPANPADEFSGWLKSQLK
jgi:chromosome segregation ATPase